MSEQQAPENQDTSAVAGPIEAPGATQEQQEIDWQKRHQDLQPEYTRVTQEAAQLRERNALYEQMVDPDVDADTRRQAAAALGYELPDEEEFTPAEEYDDPNEARLAELERFRDEQRELLARQQEEQQVQQLHSWMDSQLAQEKSLSDQDRGIIKRLAATSDWKDGRPDVEGALQEFQSWELGRQKQWRNTKRAPYVSPGGQSANEVPDLSSHDGRVQYAMQKWQEAQDG
jgi:hypothetical protein